MIRGRAVEWERPPQNKNRLKSALNCSDEVTSASSRTLTLSPNISFFNRWHSQSYLPVIFPVIFINGGARGDRENVLLISCSKKEDQSSLHVAPSLPSLLLLTFFFYQENNHQSRGMSGCAACARSPATSILVRVRHEVLRRELNALTSSDTSAGRRRI